MIFVVFLLCALASLACTVLLWRAYRQTGAALLRRSAWCFGGLFLNNLLLVIDVRVVPEVDLAFIRMVPALVGVLILVYGLVWEGE